MDKSRPALALAFLCLAFSGVWGSEHPVPLEKGVDAKACLECHEDKTKGKAVHSAMAMGCTTCHEITTDNGTTTVNLTAPTARGLCLQCHADQSPAKGHVHPPVAADCTKCHSPHSSPNKYQLLKPTSGGKDDNLCLTCHDKGLDVPDKGSRHAALDIGCETCHQTHKVGDPAKAEFAFHLTKAPPALCLDCHDVKDKALIAAHRDQPVAQADCSSCHDAHQSPSPKLMNANLHPPFADKSCDACHQPAKDGKIVVNEDGKRALCFMCHDGIQKQIETSKTQHPALQMGECTDCHNPHATRVPKLIKQSQSVVCGSCHEKSSEPVQHGPYEKGQCGQCHDPHGAELPKLLRAQGNDLCRGCHVLGQSGVKVEGKTVSLPWNREMSTAEYEQAPKLGLDRGDLTGHPLMGHPLSGKNTAVKTDLTPISCRSCHEAHTSKNSKLIDRASSNALQLCEHCHK